MLLRLFYGILCLLILVSATVVAAETAGKVDGNLQELQRLVRSGKFNFDELRTINETIALMRESARKKSRTEREQEYLTDLREVMLEKYNSDKNNSMALLGLVRYLLYMDEADEALKYFRLSKPASKEDIQWRMLGMQIYLQLGDYSRAVFFGREIQDLLSKKNPLTLSKPIAVSQVTAYRLYTPLEESKVKPGDMLTLYIEIDGAKFLESNEGARCNLDFGLELRDELQNVIDRNENYGRYDPVYAGKVNDLHATIYYRVPANLDAGNYVLALNCRDNYQTQVQAQVFFPFTVGATVRVPDKSKEEEAKAKAALIRSKLQSGSSKDILGDLTSFSDDLNYDLDKFKDKQKSGDKNKDLAEEAKKMGINLLLDRAKKTGELLGK